MRAPVKETNLNERTEKHMSYPLLNRLRVPTLHAYVGLPASGKSSDAKRRVVAQKAGAAIRVNRDEIRAPGCGDRGDREDGCEGVQEGSAVVHSPDRPGACGPAP
jgi:hypothetical protein